MKKIFALALALILALGALPAMAEYDKHLDITATYVDRGSTAIDDMYKFFTEPFNLDIEMIGIPWSAFDDTNSVMIMGGTMYDWMMINWDLNTYLSYVDQGLIKALPEDYAEKYPNIAKALEASGIGEVLTVDGVTYGIPMPILFNFSPQSYYLNMMAIYYRADWAKELGFDFGPSVTISEFEAYLKACVEKDMAGNGQTLGLSAAGVNDVFLRPYNDQWNGFYKVGDEYIWGPTGENVVEGIKNLKQAYNDGLIDPDYYALDGFSAQAKLPAGLSAACFNTGTATNYQIILDAAVTAGMENPVEKIGITMMTDDNGVWYGGEVKNFWCINVFRPDLDDETYERILAMLDYLYTKEAEEVFNMGIKGVDWDVDADGNYVSLLPAEYSNIRQKYPSGWFWRDTAICLDEFDLVNPSYSKQLLANVNAVYDYRYASAEEHGYSEYDTKVQFLATDAKKNYSVDINTEITRIVCDDTITLDQVEAEWQKFIDANRPIWEPVVEDLNQ
ncbi:MAG: hypothetical protein IJP04_07620 [Clostridia bacterium]|nr:hypothetical protein [Clostridia bacterium]